MPPTKLSIRFFQNRRVRAAWDDEHNKWWFAVTDIVGLFNEQDNHEKNRNYWKYLKTKLKNEGNQLVSITNQLKLTSTDGKKYNTDVLDADGVTQLAKLFPRNKAMAFMDEQEDDYDI